MEQELIANLRACGEAYAKAQRIGLVTVGHRAAGDGRFFERLETGKTLTLRKYDEAMQWFSDHWPAGADWPAGVPRPEPRPVEAESPAGAG